MKVVSSTDKFLLSPKGRISRKEYWIKFALPVVAIYWIAYFFIEIIENNSEAFLGFVKIDQFLLIWPSIAISIKRFHDRGKSWYWVLVGLIPIIGWLWILIENGFLAGEKTDNKYGESTA
jgi:uncharacterized membrane protein YhaH (DUF805 family)